MKILAAFAILLALLTPALAQNNGSFPAAAGSNPCTTTASSLQYNASSSFGCVAGATSNGTTTTFASSDLLLAGSGSGTTTLNASASASGTLTLPAATDTLTGKATTDTLTNKTYDTAGTGNTFKINGTSITAISGNTATVGSTSGAFTSGNCVKTDASHNLVDAAGTCGGTGSPGGSNTQLQYNNSSSFGGIAGATTDGTITTFASGDLSLAGSSSGHTLLNATAAASGTLTLPAATDTLTGKATTDTLTNKTLDTGGTGNVFKIAGTQITAISGNTATVGSTTGTLTSTHCVNIDASGNLKDSGSTCGGGGGGLTVNSTTVSGGTANNLLYTDGSLLQATGGITFTATGQETHTQTALATSPTAAAILTNTTAALVGAQFQYSPQVQFTGQGWQQNAAASQTVSFTAGVVSQNDGAGSSFTTLESLLMFTPTVNGSAQNGIAFCSATGSLKVGTGTYIVGLDGSLATTSQNCDNNRGFTGIGPVGAANIFGAWSTGTNYISFGNKLVMGSGVEMSWASTSNSGNANGDTGISRGGAAVFDFGNGTLSDVTGTLQAAHATLNALANSATTSAVCYNTGTGVLTYDATVGTCTTSTMRVKHDIVPLHDTAMLEGVLRMRPVSFEYNDEVRTPGLQLGLIAEDMAAIDPNLVALDAEGKPVAIKFLGPVVAYLVGALKAQQAEIVALKQKIH